MDSYPFSLSFFVIRLVLGLIFTGLFLAIIRPPTLMGYVALVAVSSLPAIFALGVAAKNASACTMAGFASAALLIVAGMLFGKFPGKQLAPVPQASESATER